MSNSSLSFFNGVETQILCIIQVAVDTGVISHNSLASILHSSWRRGWFCCTANRYWYRYLRVSCRYCLKSLLVCIVAEVSFFYAFNIRRPTVSQLRLRPTGRISELLITLPLSLGFLYLPFARGFWGSSRRIDSRLPFFQFVEASSLFFGWKLNRFVCHFNLQVSVWSWSLAWSHILLYRYTVMKLNGVTRPKSWRVLTATTVECTSTVVPKVNCRLGETRG